MSANRRIRIQGTSLYTSAKQALKYLKARRARYIDEGTIQFIEGDPRHASTLRQMRSGAEYDALIASGMATLGGIQGLPVLNPVKLITDPSKGPRRPPLRPWKGRDGKLARHSKVLQYPQPLRRAA